MYGNETVPVSGSRCSRVRCQSMQGWARSWVLCARAHKNLSGVAALNHACPTKPMCWWLWMTDTSGLACLFLQVVSYLAAHCLSFGLCLIEVSPFQRVLNRLCPDAMQSQDGSRKPACLDSCNLCQLLDLVMFTVAQVSLLHHCVTLRLLQGSLRAAAAETCWPTLPYGSAQK